MSETIESNQRQDGQHGRDGWDGMVGMNPSHRNSDPMTPIQHPHSTPSKGINKSLLKSRLDDIKNPFSFLKALVDPTGSASSALPRHSGSLKPMPCNAATTWWRRLGAADMRDFSSKNEFKDTYQKAIHHMGGC